MSDSLPFYFDFISPYAYLGWEIVKRLAKEETFEVEPVPVLFAALLNHYGQLGPAEIPAKRRVVFRDVVRRAAELDVPIGVPASHPFNPILVLRTTIAGEMAPTLIDDLFRATWVDGVDVSDPEALRAHLESKGHDGSLIDQTRDEAVKAALKETGVRAIAGGVFGVPTLVVGDDLLWGQDRLADVRLIRAGKDPARDLGAAFDQVKPSALRPKAQSR